MRELGVVCGLAVLAGLAGCGDDEQAKPGPTGAGGAGGTGAVGPGGGGDGGAGLGGAGGGGGQIIDPRFQPLVDAVEAERLAHGAPGAAIAVIEDGEITFAYGSGFKTQGGDDPIEPSTLFRIGSVNKVLTATAMLSAVEDGLLDLDDPVTDTVPSFHFNLNPAWAGSIDNRHLLTHRSGIVDYLTIDTPESAKVDATLNAFLTGSFANIGYLMAPAGEFYNYSNPGFSLAGLVTEVADGKPYREVMQERVFDPIGMDRTFFLGDDVIADGDYAVGATAYPDVPPVVEPDTYENTWARPAGYAFSSVLDLAQFVIFMMEGDDDVLSPAMRMAMQEQQVDTQEYLDVVGYGFGLQVMDGAYIGSNAFTPVKIVAHSGAIPGFAADITFLPEQRFGFVTLASGDGAYFDESLIVALQTLVDDLPDPVAGPDDSVDPQSLPGFEGLYQDDYNVGPMQVTFVNDHLEIDMPDLDLLGIPYEKELITLSPNNFLLGIQGTAIQVTFIESPTTDVTYLRTRSFVGVREAEPAPPRASIRSQAERRKAIVQSLWQAEPAWARWVRPPAWSAARF